MAQYNFTFKDRDSYKAYVADWQSSYRVASEEIRRIKRDMQASYKAGNQEAASNLQSELHYARVEANRLMNERTAATEFKNQQLALHAQAA